MSQEKVIWLTLICDAGLCGRLRKRVPGACVSKKGF